MNRKYMQKCLALLLTACMVMGIFTGTAAAAETAAVTITDTGRSLSLDDIVYIKQYAKISGDLTQKYIEENGGLLVWNSEPADIDIATADDVQEGLEYDDYYGEYTQATDGIPTKQFADELYLAIYVQNKDGTYTYGPVKEYSVQEYCEGRLEKSTNAKMKALAAAMLHYGAAAQTYFKYNTADLANANIAEDYPADTWDAGLLDAAVPYTSAPASTGDVTVVGKSLSLEGAVLVNYYFKPKTDWTAAGGKLQVWEKTTELTEDNISYEVELVYDDYYGEWVGTSDGFIAKEYNKTIHARAAMTDTDGNIHTSNIITYSPEVYAKGRINNSGSSAMVNLAKHLVMYGERALQYFGVTEEPEEEEPVTEYDYMVQDSRAYTHIMVTEDASGLEKQAADELQSHVELVSGVTLPIDTLDEDAAAFSASFAPATVSADQGGYYPVEILLRNPTDKDRVVTIRTVDDGETEPAITLRGDSGNGTTVAVDAGSQVMVSGVVAVEDEQAYGLCDIDLRIEEGSLILDTLSIPVAARGNNVPDGGFETDSHGWSGGTVSSDVSKIGSASYMIDSEAVMDRKLPLRSGGLYYLSFYARTDAENVSVYGKVTDLDTYGSVLAVPMSLYTRAAVEKDTWTYCEMTFTANAAADAAYAASRLSLAADGGTVWVDSVRLVDCGATPVNTVNGDFETYDPDGGNYKFDDWFTASVMTNETTDVYAGAQAARLANWSAQLGMGDLTTANSADTDYTFSVWLKAPGGSGTFTFGVQPVIDGYTQTTEWTTVEVTDQWERYTIDFRTPFVEAGHLYNGTYFYFKWSGSLLMDEAAVQIVTEAKDIAAAFPGKFSFTGSLQGWFGDAAADSTVGNYRAGSMKLSAGSEASFGTDLQLISGNLYTLGFWATAAADDAAVYAKVSDHDASGTALAAPMSAYSRASAGTDGWTYHEIHFIANTMGDADYAGSVLSVSNASDCDIWIDDLTLADTETAPENEKDNPDFETYEEGAGDGNTEFAGYYFGTLDYLETADVYTGAQAAGIKNSSANLGIHGYNDSGFLFTQPGCTYAFSVWMKSETPDAYVTFTTSEYLNNASIGHTEKHTFALTDRWERYEFTYETAEQTDDVWKFNGSYMNFKYYGNILMDHCTVTVLPLASGADLDGSEAAGVKYTFESGLQGWTGGNLSRETARNGAQSLQIQGEATAAAGTALQLSSGGLYRVGLWVKADALGTPRLQLKIRDLDASGNALAVPASVNARILPGSAWDYYEYNFIANFTGDESYDSSVLELVCESEGSIYVDDVTLLYSAVAAVNEATNSSVEDEDPGNWYLGGETYGVVTTEDAYAGSKSAKIYAGKLGYADFHMAEADTTYTLSFWAKGSTGAGGSIRWDTSEYTNYVSNGHKESHTFTLTNDWEYYSFEYTTAAATSDIWKFNGTYLNFVPVGTVYLDDLVIMKTGELDALSDGICQIPQVDEQETDLGEIPTLIEPVPNNKTVVIATTENLPQLKKWFPDDVTYLGDSDGFAVRQRGDTIYIFGTGAKGALNGTYDFMEKNLGVIWFRADDTAYDPMDDIKPADIDYAEKSPFEVRGWHLCGSGDNGEGHSDPDTEIMMTRNKLNAKMAEENNKHLWAWQRSIGIGNYTMGHNVGLLMRTSSLYDPEDDEYWPTDEDGNRHPQAGSDIYCEINYFSDKAAAAVLDSLIKKIEENPETKYIGVGQNDSDNYYVKGKSDQPFEYAPGQYVYPEDRNYMSTVLFTFINKLAEPIKEKYPHITLTTFAYNWSTPAPAMEVCDNVQILFCNTGENLKYAFGESGEDDPNYLIYNDLMDWAERGANIVVYNYYGTSLAASDYARPIYGTIQKNMQLYAENGFAGVLPEGQTDSSGSASGWAMCHMTYWLYHKLTWDPDLDVDAQIEYFCNKVYGSEAGPYMREYYRLLKECFDNTDCVIHYTDRVSVYAENFILNQGSKMTEMQEAITNAYWAAEGAYKDRIEYIYDTFIGLIV